MNKPKISIVTPSFNQGMFLEETIKSVLDQNYENLEYVIIDGGSTDNSLDIIKKYEHKLHKWISEEDEGHGHALNKGFSYTTGDIMAWINSDDKYTPWSFRSVAEIFTQFPHVTWISGFNTLWSSTGAMISVNRRPKNIYDYLLGKFEWIQQESVFWRRSLWEKAGGYINQQYSLMVDGELWTRFFLHADLYSVDCVLAGYRMHPANRAHMNYDDCIMEMKQAIEVMRKNCPQNIINNFNSLISNTNPELVKSVLLNANYKNIAFSQEKWMERRLPFRKFR